MEEKLSKCKCCFTLRGKQWDDPCDTLEPMSAPLTGEVMTWSWPSRGI